MITIFEGGIGSGKTYDGVRKIIANLKKGRRIVTNIDGFQNEINNEVIKHLCNLDDFQFTEQVLFLTSEDVVHFWELTKPNDMIVIDETQKFFGSRNWQSKANNDFLMWATEHRHNGQDLLLIAPKLKMIDTQVRSMSEWIYSYRKMNMFGGLIQKKYIRFAYYESDDTPMGKKICTYDQNIFNCYSSYFVKEAKEIGIEKGANLLKHPVFFILPIVFGFFIYFLFNSSIMGGGVFGNKALAQQKENIKNHEQPVEVARSDALPVVHDFQKSELKELNIIGYVNGKRIIKTDKGIIFE